MTLATFDAPHTATGTDAETTLTDRTATLNTFIFKNYSMLVEACYEAFSALLVMDADRILTNLCTSIHRYGGPLEETPFLRWATRFVAKDAERYEITTRILTEYGRVIHAAIHKSLWTSAIDRSVEHEDVYWEVAALIFTRSHSLNRKGRAKLSTRLTALAKKHCYLFHNAKSARRRKLVLQRVEAGEPIAREQLSDEEIASLNANSAMVYDPGYSLCGLSLD